MIVVDTNLLVAVLSRDPHWAAPLLWRSEFRNTLSRLMRRREMTLDGALRIMDDVQHAMAGRELAVVSHQVLALAHRSGCSAYDCEFVAAAEDLGVPLVATDSAVLTAFPAVAVRPEVFAA